MKIFSLIALRRFAKNENGATAVEYGIITALVSVVIITSVSSIGTNMSATFSTIGGALS